jgi:hypothetical protein
MYSPLGLGEAQAFSSAKIEPINPAQRARERGRGYRFFTNIALLTGLFTSLSA